MKRLTRFQENISVKKATNYAIIINSLEILLILGVMTLVVISPQYDFSPRMVRLLVGVAAAVIIWGAVMDIREAHVHPAAAESAGRDGRHHRRHGKTEQHPPRPAT